MQLTPQQLEESGLQGYLFFPGAFGRGESELPKQAARDEVWRQKPGVAPAGELPTV